MENKHKILPRDERHHTHTYVTVQKNKLLNITHISGVLLDISSAGFKIELVGNKMPIVNDKNYWLKIPLHQLGFVSPKKLLVKIRSVWVDQNRHLFGGLFLDTSNEQKEIIESVISILINKHSKNTHT